MKIAILSSHTPSLFWFRMDMMLEFLHRGYEVVAIGNEDENEWRSLFSEKGIRYRQAKIKRNGTNPIGDLRTFLSLRRILKEERPDKIFTYQAKTVIYGGLAAHNLGISDIYPLIGGIGSVFLNNDLKSKIIRFILKTEYRISMAYAPKVFFQNTDDSSLFVNNGIVRKDQIIMLNGSGVNLDYFTVQQIPAEPVFLFIGRLIKDKGVFEYLEACRIVKTQMPDTHCLLVGPFDSNPTSLKPEELQPYIDDGIVEYFGEQADVRPYLAACSVFVLPSYREGTPKSVLEAMATGRAVITTNAPGCRETVKDNENGYLVPVRNVELLAVRMTELARSPELVRRMAKEGRKRAEEKFDVNLINTIICRSMKIYKNNEEKKNVALQETYG